MADRVIVGTIHEIWLDGKQWDGKADGDVTVQFPSTETTAIATTRRTAKQETKVPGSITGLVLLVTLDEYQQFVGIHAKTTDVSILITFADGRSVSGTGFTTGTPTFNATNGEMPIDFASDNLVAL